MQNHYCYSSSVSGGADRVVDNNKVMTRSKGAVKLSTDPQSVAARQRRHRISDRFKILQSMVPGGTRMDTVSMLDEAIHYVKFLKTQIWLHQAIINNDSNSFVQDDPQQMLIGNSISGTSSANAPSLYGSNLEAPSAYCYHVNLEAPSLSSESHDN